MLKLRLFQQCTRPSLQLRHNKPDSIGIARDEKVFPLLTPPFLQSDPGGGPAGHDCGYVPVAVLDYGLRTPDSPSGIYASSQDSFLASSAVLHAGWPGNQGRSAFSAAAKFVYGPAGMPVLNNTVDQGFADEDKNTAGSVDTGASRP
jgi:hypothetical protein